MRTAARRPSGTQLHGTAASVGGADWWEIQFQPLAGTQDLLGILGTIRVLAAPVESPLPLPEKLMALRDRQARALFP